MKREGFEGCLFFFFLILTFNFNFFFFLHMKRAKEKAGFYWEYDDSQ